jgi:hypothetical protein
MRCCGSSNNPLKQLHRCSILNNKLKLAEEKSKDVGSAQKKHVQLRKMV